MKLNPVKGVISSYSYDKLNRTLEALRKSTHGGIFNKIRRNVWVNQETVRHVWEMTISSPEFKGSPDHDYSFVMYIPIRYSIIEDPINET